MQRVDRIVWIALGLMLSVASSGVEADVVAVVSSKSAVTALSKSQVADIFLGKTSRFPDGSRAVPIDQAEGTVEHDEFYSRFVGKSAAQVKAHWSKIIFTGRGQPPKAVASGIEAKKLLAQNVDAIGYIERSLMDGSVRIMLQL